MRTRTFALIGLAALTLTGCGGDGGDAEASMDCETVSDAAMTAIADGANETPIDPVAAAALPVPDAESYVIAMTFAIEGQEDQVGVWEATALDGAGSLRGVDGFAHEFTDWPESALTVADDVVEDVKGCL